MIFKKIAENAGNQGSTGSLFLYFPFPVSYDKIVGNENEVGFYGKMRDLLRCGV